MRIKSVLHILSEIRYLRSILKKYSSCFAAGKYIVFDGFRAMSLNDESTLKRAHLYFDKPGVSARMASIASKLNKINYYTNKNKKSTSEYDAFYTANNFDKVREVKLFSFKRNKILTVCTSLAEMEKQLKQYDRFKNAYSMPEVKRYEAYPNSFEISMIDIKEFPGNKLALESISKATAAFNPSPDALKRVSVKELIAHPYDNAEMNSLLDNLCDQIDDTMMDIAIPFSIQHGDLSKDNLLYGECDGKKDFWWIDWEHADERVFFYDYFFYIINSALYYDTLAYEHYMNGDADEDLKRFFAHFGLIFDPTKKKDYFLIFAIIFLKERVCNANYIEALKIYCKFINTH